jgi:D-amino-acid dehydrogenase
MGNMRIWFQKVVGATYCAPAHNHEEANVKSDVIVLGAGIVGVSVALHLQARGRNVAIIDRRGPGEETSFGNAGIIERSSVIPTAFPRDLKTILRYGLNRSSAARYHLSFLPTILPWLFQYWRQSSPRRLAQAASDLLPLIERSVLEHKLLADAAGAARLIRETGWIEIHRSQQHWEHASDLAEGMRAFNLSFGTPPLPFHLAEFDPAGTLIFHSTRSANGRSTK